MGDALPQHLSRLRKFVNEASSEIADYKLCLSKIIDLDGTDPMDWPATPYPGITGHYKLLHLQEDY